jgi:hypothetical protein
MTRDPVKDILPAEILQAIGAVAAHWSLLETVIEECLATAAALNQGARRALISQMGITARLDALLSMIRELFPDSELEIRLVEMDKTIRQPRNGLESLQAARNTTIHSYWESKDQEKAHAIRFSVRARGRIMVSLAQFNASDIWSVAKRISDMSAQMDEWCFALGYAVESRRVPVRKRGKAKKSKG